jgi:hypothetical protein
MKTPFFGGTPSYRRWIRWTRGTLGLRALWDGDATALSASPSDISAGRAMGSTGIYIYLKQIYV